jgi:hypothetical protein
MIIVSNLNTYSQNIYLDNESFIFANGNEISYSNLNVDNSIITENHNIVNVIESTQNGYRAKYTFNGNAFEIFNKTELCTSNNDLITINNSETTITINYIKDDFYKYTSESLSYKFKLIDRSSMYFTDNINIYKLEKDNNILTLYAIGKFENIIVDVGVIE